MVGVNFPKGLLPFMADGCHLWLMVAYLVLMVRVESPRIIAVADGCIAG